MNDALFTRGGEGMANAAIKAMAQRWSSQTESATSSAWQHFYASFGR